MGKQTKPQEWVYENLLFRERCLYLQSDLATSCTSKSKSFFACIGEGGLILTESERAGLLRRKRVPVYTLTCLKPMQNLSRGVLSHNKGSSCHFAGALSSAEIRSTDLHRRSGKLMSLCVHGSTKTCYPLQTLAGSCTEQLSSRCFRCAGGGAFLNFRRC